MSEITCLRCKNPIDQSFEACPQCGERVTHFQRTYATKLIDGKYQILERLGVGGMGEIFKVRHIHLNEERVIKIMRPNIATDDQSLQRFLQEARTSTMIKHRNLAMLYDFSTLDDGSYYMVWEFIDGTNIQKWVAANGPMPARLALEIAIQALTGLENLHSMGLIHRDISPENIMLSQDYHGKLLAKVIDFGIAKQLSEGEHGHGLTATGMFVGKLKYASPEQAGFIKEGEMLDARSDLYSFGVVFYEMLAGRAPFLATNPQGYILKHVTEKPLPIHELNPAITVPENLERIIMKSLEKDRDNRYLSAADFVADLEAIRQSVTPDKTYGLGERMIPITRTTAGGTKSGSAPTLGGTMPGRPTATPARGTASGTAPRAQGTVVDRPVPGGATVVDQRLGGNSATVVEAMPTSAATVVERAGGWGGAAPAEATVIDQSPMGRTMAGAPAGVSAEPETKKTGMIIAIAAVVLIALLLGGYFAMKKDTTTGGTTAGGTTDTTVTSTAPPIPSNGEAILLLTSPFGESARIENIDTKQAVTLADNILPLRKSLPAGKYRITLTDGQGAKETKEVTLEAGDIQTIGPSPKKVDPKRVAEEILNP